MEELEIGYKTVAFYLVIGGVQLNAFNLGSTVELYNKRQAHYYWFVVAFICVAYARDGVYTYKGVETTVRLGEAKTTPPRCTPWRSRRWCRSRLLLASTPTSSQPATATTSSPTAHPRPLLLRKWWLLTRRQRILELARRAFSNCSGHMKHSQALGLASSPENAKERPASCRLRSSACQPRRQAGVTRLINSVS